MKKIIYYYILLLIATSCQIYGITNDYKKLSEAEKSHIKEFNGFNNTEPKSIYEINGIQLKEELKNNKKSIIYTFINGCGPDCFRIEYMENYAKENNYNLYLVMNGYSRLNQTLEQYFTIPLYSVDAEYYGTKFSSKYSTMFKNEIAGNPIDYVSKEYYGNFYFYEKDQLIKITEKITD
jgi:hypothetical protein